MKTQLLLATVLVLSSLCTAQVVTTFKTRGEASASVTTSVGSVKQSVPGNTDLKPGLKLYVARGAASASFDSTFAQSPQSVVATFDGQATAYHINNSNFGWAQSRADTLLNLNSGTTIKAVLRASWRFTDTAPHNGTYVKVDIGNNGKNDFFRISGTRRSGSDAQEFPITIGASGLDIRIEVHRNPTTSSQSSSSCSSAVRIEIVPTAGCGFLKHGVACGPSLSGTCGFGDQVTLSVTGAPWSGKGLLVLGTNQTAIPIPGSSCLLYTDPLIIVPINFSFLGTWSLTSKLPSSRPFTVTAQVGAFGSKLQTSNGLILSVPR